MALLLRYLDDMHTIMYKYGDPRTNDWLLMSSPLPTLAICLSYVYLVKVLGPRIMENRKPFELKNTLIVYNFFQVIFSTWLFYECLMGGWWGEYNFHCQPVDKTHSPTAMRLCMSGWVTGRYSLRCQPVDYSNHPETLRYLSMKTVQSISIVLTLQIMTIKHMAVICGVRMVNVCWWYYFSKFTEFMDTIFFILRKKNNHVSTLHVIHHGCMPMSVWFGVKFTPGGHSTFFGLLNTFVHIIMYSYYLLAAFGPRFQKYLWWKKYLTGLQMLQFVAIMVHAFQLLFIDCNYPRAFVWWIGMHAVMFFFLFKEFYKQAYDKKEKRKLMGMSDKLKSNGVVHENGKHYSNGMANGASNGTNGKVKNGFSYDAKDSDYYMADSNLHMRKSQMMGN